MNVKRLNGECAMLPKRATDGSAGYDLCACLMDCEEYMLEPTERRLFKTGLAIEIPEGFVGIIKPRSGLALKYGIDVMAGVIDSDYYEAENNEVGVILINHGDDPYPVGHAERIAQLVVVPYHGSPVREVKQFKIRSGLRPIVRRLGGFGSTG